MIKFSFVGLDGQAKIVEETAGYIRRSLFFLKFFFLNLLIIMKIALPDHLMCKEVLIIPLAIIFDQKEDTNHWSSENSKAF